MRQFFAFCAIVSCAEPQYVETLLGSWPSACKQNVPQGTRVSSSAEGLHLTFSNGTVETKLPCKAMVPEESLAKLRQRLVSRNQIGDIVNASQKTTANWLQHIAFDDPSATVDQFSVTLTVFPPPSTDNLANYIYWWIGAYASAPQEQYGGVTLQPVLHWHNGDYWASSWNCCPAGHQVEGPQLRGLSPGDKVSASVKRISGQEYEVLMQTDAGASSSLIANDGLDFSDPQVCLETYLGEPLDCSALPAGSVELHDLSLSGGPSHWGSASWYGDYNVNSACGWEASASGGDVVVRRTGFQELFVA